MLEFQPITAEILRDNARYLRCQVSRFCDYTPGIIHMWHGLYSYDYVIHEGGGVVGLRPACPWICQHGAQQTSWDRAAERGLSAV